LIDNFKKISKRENFIHAGIFSLLILVFLFLTIGSVYQKSLTYDEPQHYRYGEQILNGDSDRFDDSKMPFSVLNAVVSEMAKKVLGERIADPWHVMSAGRLATIFFSLGVAAFIYMWARDWYGRNIALVAMALYMLEPNIIAHSRMITTDIYATGTITIALYLFYRFLDKPGIPGAILAAIALGLCQIAKYTGLFLYPLWLIMGLVYFRREIWNRIMIPGIGQKFKYVGKWIAYVLLFILFSILIINIGFLFNKTGTLFGDCVFRSEQLQMIQSRIPQLASIPLPVPYPYVDGLDRVLYNEQTGENYGLIYLNGELRDGLGFPGYFFVAAFYKVPVALLVLLGMSFVQFFLSKSWKRSEREIVFLLLPSLYFLVYFNFFFRAQIGIRFILIIFPILIVFAVRYIHNWARFPLWQRGILVVMGIWMVVSVGSYFPHYITYFNEFVLDRNLAYKKLSDSNLDWGQDRADLQDFRIENPEVIYLPAQPTSGKIIIGINELTGVMGGVETYAWLRENFDPVDNLNHSYLIYEISDAEFQRISGDDE